MGKIFESTNWMKRKSSIYQWRHNARLNEWMNAIFEKKNHLDTDLSKTIPTYIRIVYRIFVSHRNAVIAFCECFCWDFFAVVIILPIRKIPWSQSTSTEKTSTEKAAEYTRIWMRNRLSCDFVMIIWYNDIEAIRYI